MLWYGRNVTPLWKLDDYIPAPLQYSIFFCTSQHVKLRSKRGLAVIVPPFPRNRRYWIAVEKQKKKKQRIMLAENYGV